MMKRERVRDGEAGRDDERREREGLRDGGKEREGGTDKDRWEERVNKVDCARERAPFCSS